MTFYHVEEDEIFERYYNINVIKAKDNKVAIIFDNTNIVYQGDYMEGGVEFIYENIPYKLEIHTKAACLYNNITPESNYVLRFFGKLKGGTSCTKKYFTDNK